ncbi:hypothetical protein Agub_g7416 [Astrephomene gubernaculifera]|uniref:SET domain-containing protein n=1 Tax=Astrephomene gubernaculifera TaxID=47775 RepID=A0AAD3HMN9_9CHLO|nr:hypothetical protein Agub_g7416 [Astrephomene gubernaculifera]
MQCWQAPLVGVFGQGPAPCRRLCRRPGLQAFAKLKYKTNIAQNHTKKSNFVSIDYDRLYSQPSYKPGRQYGPLKLVQLPGRGRGLVTDRSVQAGETLLLCEPVGGRVLDGPAGREPQPEELAAALEEWQREGKLGPADRARLRLLYEGPPADPSSPAPTAACPSLDDFRKLEDKLRRQGARDGGPKKARGKGFGAGPAGGAAGGAETGIDLASLSAPPLSPSELRRLAKYDSWGNAWGELGAAGLRGEELEAVMGIWPEFSLLNHSCAPNTVAFTVGSCMLVQAVRKLPPGAEVTTSYLADLALAPLQQRRQWLQGAYGFTCACERCQAESSLPPAVTAAVSAAYSAATAPAAVQLAAEARATSDRGALCELEGQLAGAVEALETAMEEAGLEGEVRQWLRCSAYPAYRSLAAIRDLPPPPPQQQQQHQPSDSGSSERRKARLPLDMARAAGAAPGAAAGEVGGVFSGLAGWAEAEVAAGGPQEAVGAAGLDAAFGGSSGDGSSSSSGVMFGGGSSTSAVQRPDQMPYSDPEVPADLAGIVEAVVAASDMHFYLVYEAMSRATELYGRDDPRVTEATKHVIRVLLTRYGRPSDKLLFQLLRSRMCVGHYLGDVTQLPPPPSSSAESTPGDGGLGQGHGALSAVPRDAGSALAAPLLGSGAAAAASPAQLRGAAEWAAAQVAAVEELAAGMRADREEEEGAGEEEAE